MGNKVEFALQAHKLVGELRLLSNGQYLTVKCKLDDKVTTVLHIFIPAKSLVISSSLFSF